MSSSLIRHIACVLLTLSVANALGADVPPMKLHVLFIGNSLTSRNNLPGIIAGMAAASGRELTFSAQLVGGATLKKHWDDGKALEKIKEGHWDFVVLQDLSREAYKDRDAMDTYIRLFDAEIHKVNAKTMLYMTWALENAPEEYPKIEGAYTALAKELHAQLVPAGLAWHTITAGPGKPAFELYVADHKHPQPAGSYLSACVFYRAFFNTPSAGLPGRIELKTKALTDLPKENAAALQKVADGIALPPVE